MCSIKLYVSKNKQTKKTGIRGRGAESETWPRPSRCRRRGGSGSPAAAARPPRSPSSRVSSADSEVVGVMIEGSSGCAWTWQ